MSKVTIKSGKTLKQLVGAIFEEGIKASLYQNSIDEKERQQKLMGEKEDDDLFGDSGDDTGKDAKAAPEQGGNEAASSGDQETSEPATGGNEKPSASVAAELEKMKAGTVSSKDVIDRLNAIRSGRSFKDTSISGPLEQYVESLTKTERVALLAFLKGISQIVTGEIPADQAVQPDDNAPDVEMKKGGDTKKVEVKPVIIKSTSKGVKRPSGEDTSGPSPIQPKKK